MFRVLILAAGLTLTACSQKGAETQAVNPDGLPPLSQALSCLSGTGPIIAAHRGRDKIKRHPENALSSLKSLKLSGFVIAEIDVSRLKDGSHILHHDGVWDETTTGTGVVASTRWEDAQKLLLKTRGGKPRSERLSTLDDILSWANQDFYLELDFKSSADEHAVIKAVHAAGMTDHVVLIAYSARQADFLRGLSRRITGKTVLISGPPGSTSFEWAGTKAYNVKAIRATAKSGRFTAYGMMSPKYAKRADYSPLSVLVSDFPREAKDKVGIKAKDRARIAACDI